MRVSLTVKTCADGAMREVSGVISAAHTARATLVLVASTAMIATGNGEAQSTTDPRVKVQLVRSDSPIRVVRLEGEVPSRRVMSQLIEEHTGASEAIIVWPNTNRIDVVRRLANGASSVRSVKIADSLKNARLRFLGTQTGEVVFVDGLSRVVRVALTGQAITRVSLRDTLTTSVRFPVGVLPSGGTVLAVSSSGRRGAWSKAVRQSEADEAPIALIDSVTLLRFATNGRMLSASSMLEWTLRATYVRTVRQGEADVRQAVPVSPFESEMATSFVPTESGVFVFHDLDQTWRKYGWSGQEVCSYSAGPRRSVAAGKLKSYTASVNVQTRGVLWRGGNGQIWIQSAPDRDRWTRIDMNCAVTGEARLASDVTYTAVRRDRVSGVRATGGHLEYVEFLLR
jgi:hypothetical protein